MNDYQLIRKDPSYSRLRSIDIHVIHNESIKWLEKSLGKRNSKTNVVITHHVPRINSINEKYRNDLISAGYASNLECFIQRTKPDLWIHGHVNEAFDYCIGQTRIICNPKGYPGEVVNGFRDNLMVEIKT